MFQQAEDEALASAMRAKMEGNGITLSSFHQYTILRLAAVWSECWYPVHTTGRTLHLTAGKAQAQKKTVQRLFKLTDKDGSGGVDIDEFVVLCSHLQIQKPIREVRLLFSQIDKNNDGKVELSEFWDWYTASWMHLFKGGAGI